MQTLHTIEHNGNFVVRFANNTISLTEDEYFTVAITLRQKPTGHLPKVSVYGTTFHFDHGVNSHVDDTPLVEFDVTKIYIDDNDLIVEIHNGTTRNVDPLLFDITWYHINTERNNTMKTSDEVFYEAYLHETYETFIADLLVNEGSTISDLKEREPFDQWVKSDTKHLSFAEWREEL